MSQASTPVSKASTPGSPLGEREEELLQLYFQLISHFAFDKAKDVMDKEKDGHKWALGSSWLHMVQTLAQFAMAEKSYNSFSFLEQKWFGRSSKDTLRNSYMVLNAEFRRMEDNMRPHDPAMDAILGASAEFEHLLAHLSGQLGEYIRARQKTMEFFEQVITMGTNKNMNYQDLVDVIMEIIQIHTKNFHHPILANLKSGFTYECDCINHLLQGQILMTEGQFLPSLLQLHQAHSKLTSWGATSQARETTKRGMFGGSSKTVCTWPLLYQWLLRYKSLLVAKFSLYFYDVLSKQTQPVEMKTLSAKNVEDYVARVMAFQKKSDALSVCLVLDTQAMEYTYKGLGYHHPDKQVEQPTGLDSYPAIFSYPGEHPASHWPNVVMIINGRNSDQDKVHYFYDTNFSSTYFIVHAETRVYLVVIYDTKKSEKDSFVNNFMTEFSSMLRCVKHFSNLKPGSRVSVSRK